MHYSWHYLMASVAYMTTLTGTDQIMTIRLALLAHWSFCNKKFELTLTGRAKAYSSFCSQTVSLSPAILSWLLPWYHSLMSSCAGFLEPRKSRLGPSKSTFNAENFILQLVHVYLNWFRRSSFLKCVLEPEIAKEIHKTPYFNVQGHPRSLNLVTIESQCMTSLIVT